MQRNNGTEIIRYILIMSFFFLMKNTFAQKTYSKSIGIITENDSYMLMGKDGYYTNGLTLSYNWTTQDSNKTTINTIEIGQLMYNARNGSYKEAWKIDRPVTAYLFGRFGQTRFIKSNVLSWKLGIGTIGPNALGRQMQEFIHSSLGMYKPQEWQYQLRNAFSADANITYAPQIFKEQATVNLYPVVASDLGLTFTNIKASTILTIGKKNTNSKSSLWNASLNKTESDSDFESFFFFKPTIQYNIYNATIQGGMFSDDPNAGTLNRLLFIPKIGWQYARKRISLNLSISYTNKEAKEQRNDQWYGSIVFNYFLK